MGKTPKKKNNDNKHKSFFRRNCIEITSVFIAMLALGLTIYQGIQARYHNRLTVMPLLRIEHSASKLNNDYSISIRNDGLGPARITGIEVNVGKDFFRFDGEIDYSVILNSLKNQHIADLDSADIQFISFEPNIYIDKGELFELLKLSPMASKELIDGFVYASKKIDFCFCYSSIYGDTFYVSRESGESNDNSCRFDGTISIFGKKFRKEINFPPIDTKITHGY